MSGLELATTLVPVQSGLTLPDFILVGPEFRCVCLPRILNSICTNALKHNWLPNQSNRAHTTSH